MAIEEVFDVELPETGPTTFDGHSELVDWLEVSLSKQCPNQAARARLQKLAGVQRRPELAEGLDGSWRREQIEAIVREIFR